MGRFSQTLLVCLVLAGSAVSAERSLVAPKTGDTVWKERRYDAAGAARLSDAVVESAGEAAGNAGVVLPLVPPGAGEIFRTVEGLGKQAKRLNLSFRVPQAASSKCVLKVFVRDWDYLWWQVRIEDVVSRHGTGRIAISVPLAGDDAAAAWEPVGHGRVWHALTADHAIELGVAAEHPAGESPRSADAPPFLLLGAAVESAEPAASADIRSVSWWPRRPKALEPVEMRFHVDAGFANPFDSEDIAVRGTVVRPDGTEDAVEGFYCADFRFRDPYAVEVRELLTPQGNPDFRIRYTPRAAGRHEVRIVATAGEGGPAVAEFAVNVSEAEGGNHGFVRVDEEQPRFLEYGDGTVFQGIGMNVRSPYDTRYRRTVPFTKWRDEGLHLYRRLFPAYGRNGINVVEVWMSSWWLALEWIPDAVGNHGVGWMNQYRAWMLDRIFQWAAENDIYVVLVFNNHGKFGEYIDSEWERNPYNAKNGGFLESATEFFSNERAFRTFRRFARYAVARWGCHPNLLMWKLFTEIDLTGDNREFYKQPVMADWHRRACEAVRDLDPYDHIVTTHWMLSYKQINPPVAELDGLDVLTTDAYYLGRHHGVKSCLRLICEGTDFGERFGKPLIVTEFGGSPHADSMRNLIKEAHAGIWEGFFCKAAVSPFFWWFGLVDEQNLYGSSRALARFAAGEDRRTLRRGADPGEGPFRVRSLQNRRRFLAWIVDTEYYFSDQENQPARPRANAVVKYDGLAPGVYRMQFWNCHTGAIVHQRKLRVAGAGAGRIALPEFTRDIALKITPWSAQAAE